MKSNGTVGEEYAVHAFRMLGWTMQRTQPETKCIGNGKLIPMPSDGVPDFTGFNRKGEYIACEVKESDDSKHPPSMPCSRLSVEQRNWMDDKGIVIHRRVLVFWKKKGIATLFTYKNKGSYKMGEVGACNV